MAVPEQIPVVNYVADGIVNKFDVPFEYDQQSDLHVYVDGVGPTIDKYFFADNAFNFYIAPTSGQAVKIKRITPKERDTDYNLHTNTVRPKALNTDFDRLWYVLQEVFSDVGGLSQTVQDEIIARIQGDEDLLNQLTAEISARMLGDEAVTEDLKNYVNNMIALIIGDPSFNGINADKVNDASGLSQQSINDLSITPYHFWGIGDKVYHPLSERYSTLSDAQAVYPFATSLDESIDACAVQAFFNFCDANFVEGANISFEAYITKPIVRLNRNPKTKFYYGDLTLYSEHQMEYMLRLAGDHCKYIGTIRVSGKEVASFVNRNIKDGIICGGDDVYFMNSYIESVVGVCLQGTTVTLHQNCHFTKINRAESSRCGSCLIGSTNHSLKANILGRSDIGTTINQRTTLTVDKLPVTTSVVGGGVYDRRNGIFAVINNEIYEVYEIDANSITVYPRVDSEITTGSLNYIFGGTVALAGNNTAQTSVDKIHAITSGIGLSCRSLYGLSVNTLTTEYCGIGLLVGNRGGAHIGTTIGSFYAEANDFDRVDSWISNYNAVRILEDIAVNTNKVVSLYDFRSVSTNLLASKNSLDYGRLNVGEFSLSGMSFNPAVNTDSRSGVVNLTSSYEVSSFSATNIAFEVTADANLFRLFKNRFKLVTCSSLNGSGVPATLKIRCDAAKQILGLGSPATVSVGGVSKNEYVIDTSQYSKAIHLAIHYDYTTSNYGASILTDKDIRSSVTYDPPPIPANGNIVTTVTLNGATLGQVVQAAFGRYHADIEISAVVSAANTVTVKFKNTSAAEVDLASGTLTVKLI